MKLKIVGEIGQGLSVLGVIVCVLGMLIALAINPYSSLPVNFLIGMGISFVMFVIFGPLGEITSTKQGSDAEVTNGNNTPAKH